MSVLFDTLTRFGSSSAARTAGWKHRTPNGKWMLTAWPAAVASAASCLSRSIRITWYATAATLGYAIFTTGKGYGVIGSARIALRGLTRCSKALKNSETSSFSEDLTPFVRAVETARWHSSICLDCGADDFGCRQEAEEHRRLGHTLLHRKQVAEVTFQ